MKIGNKRIPIREEYPRPMQCKNCLKYEHTAKYCRSLGTQRCFKCGSLDHKSNSCSNSIKCFNCGGSHHAFARDCLFHGYFQEAYTRSRRYGITVREAKEDMKEEGMQLPHKTFADSVKSQKKATDDDNTHAAKTVNIKEQSTIIPKIKATNDLEVSNRFTVLSNLEENNHDENVSLGLLAGPQPKFYNPIQANPEDISNCNNNNVNMSKKTNAEKINESEDIDMIENILRELDGASEVGKRPRASSDTYSPKKNNSHSPNSKCLKTASSEETIIFATDDKDPSQTIPSNITEGRKETKIEINIKPYKSLIRDYPMPPGNKTGDRSKTAGLLNRNPNNYDTKSSNTENKPSVMNRNKGHKTHINN